MLHSTGDGVMGMGPSRGAVLVSCAGDGTAMARHRIRDFVNSLARFHAHSYYWTHYDISYVHIEFLMLTETKMS